MLQIFLALLILVASTARAADKADNKDSAPAETKKQEKRGLLGLGYGYAYDGGYDIGAGNQGWASAPAPVAVASHGWNQEPAHFAHYAPAHHVSTHSEKTYTFVKKVPVPYPVEKHIPYPVEKHVPYPVKVRDKTTNFTGTNTDKWSIWLTILT